MTRTQRIGTLAFVLVLAAAAVLLLKTNKDAVPVPLEIGPDTTRITVPLDANGDGFITLEEFLSFRQQMQ